MSQQFEESKGGYDDKFSTIEAAARDQLQQSQKEIKSTLDEFNLQFAHHKQTMDTRIKELSDSTATSLATMRTTFQSDVNDLSSKISDQKKTLEDKLMSIKMSTQTVLEDFESKSSQFVASFDANYAAAHQKSQQQLADQVRETERAIKEMQALAQDIRDKNDSAQKDIMARLHARENDMIVRFDDMDQRIKHLASQIPLIESTSELKNNLESDLASLQGELTKLEVFRTELANLDQEFQRLGQLDKDLNGKLQRFTDEKAYIERLEDEFNQLKELSTSMDSKIQTLREIDENVRQIDSEINGFHDTLEVISSRYDELERKDQLIDRTVQDMENAYNKLEVLESRINGFNEELDSIPSKIQGVHRDVTTLLESNGRINETMEKLNSLDTVLSQAEDRIDKVLNAQSGIARTEERIQEVAKVADEHINLLHTIYKHDNPDGDSPSSELTTMAKRQHVKDLTRRGWSATEIANSMKISVSEVNLILDLVKSDR